MTTLTLTPNPALATVTVTVASAPSGAVTITRVDANGTASVRLQTGAAPISGTLVVIDHEAALTGLVRYDVLDSASATVSASTTLASATAPPLMLRSVQQPSIAATPMLLLTYVGTRAPAAVTHEPIDRPDPLPIFTRRPLRSGTLEFLCADYAKAAELDAVLTSGQALMLRQTAHAGMDMYLYASGETRLHHLERTIDGWRWGVDVEYREITSPALPLLGSAGWSFADVKAGYADFASVRTAFADFASLAAGTPS